MVVGKQVHKARSAREPDIMWQCGLVGQPSTAPQHEHPLAHHLIPPHSPPFTISLLFSLYKAAPLIPFYDTSHHTCHAPTVLVARRPLKRRPLGNPPPRFRRCRVAATSSRKSRTALEIADQRDKSPATSSPKHSGRTPAAQETSRSGIWRTSILACGSLDRLRGIRRRRRKRDQRCHPYDHLWSSCL